MRDVVLTVIGAGVLLWREAARLVGLRAEARVPRHDRARVKERALAAERAARAAGLLSRRER